MYNLHRVFLYIYPMIDFTKKIYNSDKFRRPALTFIETGKYCNYPKGTTEYIKFWEQEMNYCINGYTADDGEFITGYNYFYLNYCPIQRIVYEKGINKHGKEVIKRVRKLDFPDFYDYDYYFFQAVEEAEEQGKHLIVAKARRKGFSYKGSAMLCRNFFLIPDSKSYVYASNKQYLTEDGILTKAWLYMDFIDEHTAWAKKRQVANTQMRRRASMIVTDEYGNKVEVGYKSEIIGVSLKDNPDAGHPYSQTIYTPDGKTTWENIKIGSKVFAEDGTIATVKDVIELGDKDIYRFTLSDGRVIESTDDHKWRLMRRGYCRKNNKESKGMKLYEITTSEIHNISKNNSYLTNPFKFLSPNCINDFEYKDVPVDAYTLGLLLGDGSIKKSSKNTVPITQLPADMEEIKKFIPYNVRKYNSKKGIDYVIDIENCLDKFKDLNLLDKTAGTKFVPDTYKYNISKIRLEVLNGLLDTDGSVTKDYGVIEYVSKSKQLAEDAAWLCRSLGINCKLRSKIINDNAYYRLYIYCRHDETRLFNLPRKKERLKLKNNNNFANSKRLHPYIVSSEIVRKERAKCITIDNDSHQYYIGDFIPTFNCRGKAGKLILWEEAGSFPQLEAAWQIARPSVEQDGVAFGLMLAFGTGGDEGPAVSALREGFYKPESFNCLAFENIWEDSIQSNKCGFFVPQHTNLDIRDEEGNRLYMDKDGNTLHAKAKRFILDLRETELKNAKSSTQVDRYVAEHAETPSESFTEFSGNIFPKKELQKQLARIRTNKKLSNAKQIGDLTMVDGQPVWNMKKYGDITEYPLPKTADPTGAVVIWEHPVKDAPFGLYIIGVDSYDYDESGTNSLGSCLVYKRFQDFESYSDVIVAEYTGRPATAEIFYENVRRLAVYYNARIMYENQNKGIFTYFKNHHCDYLLADQPDILKDIVGGTTVNRGKGSHMTKEIKLWAFGKIKEWLEEDRGNGQLGLNTILSEPLLEELIKCNDKSNVDRIMSLCQIMIYREQLYNVQIKEVKEVEKKQRLFNKPLFSRDDDSEPEVFYDHNITTFMFTN